MPIVGTSGNDVLAGTSKDDEIFGLAGDDLILGSLGSDDIDGGLGDYDFVDYTDSHEPVIVNLALGVGVGGTAAGDTYTEIEGALGTGWLDRMTGNDRNNTFFGFDGVDLLYGGLGNDVLWGGQGGDVLDGGDGFDQAMYSDSSVGVHVDLMTGVGYFGTAQDDVLVDIENVVGSAFDDSLWGDDASNFFNGMEGNDILYGAAGNDQLFDSAGDDNLYGGEGSDILTGGAGRDYLIGGFENDRFEYQFVSDSRPDATVDVILDFNRAEGDIIDLSQVDANDKMDGNQTFTWRGTMAFEPGVAGQVYVLYSGGDTFLAMTTDGSSDNEMAIRISGTHVLDPGCVIL
jgi:Ca2+-binding RTX toxin-like protein